MGIISVYHTNIIIYMLSLLTVLRFNNLMRMRMRLLFERERL